MVTITTDYDAERCECISQQSYLAPLHLLALLLVVAHQLTPNQTAATSVIAELAATLDMGPETQLLLLLS